MCEAACKHLQAALFCVLVALSPFFETRSLLLKRVLAVLSAVCKEVLRVDAVQTAISIGG